MVTVIEICTMIVRSLVLSQYQRVIDRQTVRRMDTPPIGLATSRCIMDAIIIIIIIIIIYESCSAKSTNENDGALHSHKTLS